MFLITDLSDKFPHTTKVNDTKGVRNIIVGITGSDSTGNTAELIAANMRFGCEFTSVNSFKLRCIPDEDAVASAAENIAAVARRKMTNCMDDCAEKIWEAIEDTVIYDVLSRTIDGKVGIADVDVALSIGRAIAERLGIEV